MRFALLTVALACLVISTACQRNGTTPAASQTAQPYTDPDAYAVYAALLNADGPIALQRDTESGQALCSDLQESKDPRIAEAAGDYARQNANPRRLKPDLLKLHNPVKFLSADELKPIFAKGPIEGWKAFHKAYPDIGGFMTVSAVGFSNDRTVAIVDRVGTAAHSAVPEDSKSSSKRTASGAQIKIGFAAGSPEWRPPTQAIKARN